MNLPLIAFYLFGAIAVASSLMVVTAQNAVRAVLALVLTFFAMSGTWMLVHAEFLALVLILVYVGAVMTLFLFVVMMLNLRGDTIKYYAVKQAPLLFLTLLTFLGLLYLAASHNILQDGLMLQPLEKAVGYSNTQALGTVLYTDYILAFELAGVLLMLAIIAAITLTHRPPRFGKRQDVPTQIAVNRDDRVRLVKMAPEKQEEFHS